MIPQTELKKIESTKEVLAEARQQLFEINEAIEKQGGEVLPGQGGLLDTLQSSVANHLTNILNCRALVEHNLTQQRTAKTSANAVIRQLTHVQEVIKKELAETVALLGRQKVGDATITNRVTQEVVITDEALLPSDVFIWRKVPDKKKIAEKFEDGQDVPGAEIVTNIHPQIR
jgi:hypothetical protein